MRCCVNCTKVPIILDEICNKGLIGNCDSCGSVNVNFLNIEDVNESVRDLVIKTWNETSFKIKHDNRFFYHGIFDQLFSSAIQKAISRLTKNFVLFRSRLEGVKDSFGNVIAPYPISDMGAPPIALTRNGRANARGIPCFYATNNVETAIAEIRPWKDARISVARVITNVELNMIDLATIKNTFDANYPNITLADLIDYYLILFWGYELSRPISSLETSEIDYVPTQVFTEFVKHKGFDGIIFKSSLGHGDNIVVFNDSKLTIIDSQLYSVTNVKYEFE